MTYKQVFNMFWSHWKVYYAMATQTTISFLSKQKFTGIMKYSIVIRNQKRLQTLVCKNDSIVQNENQTCKILLIKPQTIIRYINLSVLQILSFSDSTAFFFKWTEKSRQERLWACSEQAGLSKQSAVAKICYERTGVQTSSDRKIRLSNIFDQSIETFD